MTKPFPCCGCGCTNCDEYTLDDWRARFCGFADGSGTLSSSTSGNTLAVDLNALADVIFQPAITVATNPQQFSATVTGLIPGSVWEYNSGATRIESVALQVTGLDDCGKRRIQDANIRATVNFNPNVIIWSALKSTFPGSPNCGGILLADEIQTRNTVVFGNAGLIKFQLDNGTPLTC